MRKLSWLLSGVIIGFIAAHFVNQNPEGRRFFERLNQGAEEFKKAMAAGYHEAEQAPDAESSEGERG